MKTYTIEGFGEIGEANLLLGVEETRGTHWGDLKPGESTFVRIRGSDTRQRRVNGKRKSEAQFERITRNL
jgi:hypothetical protein